MKKNILLLNDGRTGNYRQAQSVAKIAAGCLKKQNIDSSVDIQEIKYNGKLARTALLVFAGLASGNLKNCFPSLKKFLPSDTYQALLAKQPDIVISGGSTLAPINVMLSGKTGGKSIVVMKPPVLSLDRFDLAIIPRHDQPPEKKNVVITEGALNLIDDDYLKKQTEQLLSSAVIKKPAASLTIGLLIGGDTKVFHLSPQKIAEVIAGIKSVSQSLGADILASTSRRTSPEIEALVKKELEGCERCKFLVIANENNLPQAVGAILGLSQMVVISPESIMMISEAVSAKKHVLVFDSAGLSKKHRAFLENFAENKYIHLIDAPCLARTIKDIKDPGLAPSAVLRDRLLVEEALSNIL